MSTITEYRADKYFPFDTPRIDQMEVIHDVIDAIENDKHYILIDAGTGFGKSSVARTICDMYAKEFGKQSFILTATKQLQKQYNMECKNNQYNVNYRVGMGRSNFKCLNSHNNEDCNHSYCKNKTQSEPSCIYGLKDLDPHSHGGCKYWENKSDCIDSDVALLNYNVLMTDNQYMNHYPDRDIMICDEAHNIESKIMNEICIQLKQSTINRDIGYEFKVKEKNNGSLNYWLGELNKIINKYAEYLSQHSKDMSVKDIERYEKYSKNLLRKISIIEANPKNWVVNVDVMHNYNINKDYIDGIQFKPIFIKEYTNQLLFNSADVKIFMSGSFVDYKQFCTDLGIDLEDVYYRKAKNSFDHEHRNSINTKYAKYPLTNWYKKKSLPLMIDQLDEILYDNPNVKGLVHTNSKEFTNYIMKHLGSRPNGKRLTTYRSDIKKGKGSKDYELAKFRNSDKPLVMISYSMEEGVDLKDELCRFQVFFKCPYPNMGDKQIKARMNYDDKHKIKINSWFNRKTAERVIQMWGRAMRSETDYCQNYILDVKLLNNNLLKLLPEEMKRAMHNPVNNINDTIGVKAK